MPHAGRHFLCLLTALLAAACLSASAHAADAPRKIAVVEGVTEYRLANGLRLLAIPAPGEDTVTIHITYLVGSRHEGYGEKGMAHLLEHLLFRGTTRHPRLKEEFMRRGARWNGTTAYDRTNYFETLPAGDDNLDWALRMEADRMLHAPVSKGSLESEMTVVRNEFEMGENNAGGVLFQRMQRLAFAWHNYGSPIIGARSDIERVPVERLRAFYRTWYRPDNAVLIIAGRFDERAAVDRVSRYFGRIARPAHAMPRLYTDEPTQDGERTVTLRRAGDIPLVAAMYRVPAGAHPDYPALDVLVSLVGAVPTGRLHRALVQAGTASYAWASERALHDPGYAYFGAGLAREGSTEAARDALLRTLESIPTDPIRQEEVERAKITLLNEFDRIRLETGPFVRTLSEFSALGDWRLFFLYRDRVRGVTREDVQRVAERYLKPANRVLGVFVPTPRAERAEIPSTPDFAALVSDYRGGDTLAAGERVDTSPEAIESRVLRKTLANGIRVALLPKKTRGGLVFANLTLHWGDEHARTDRETACSLAGSMLMRGTARHTRAELRDGLEKLNSTVAASLDGAGIETRREHFAETLKWAAEILREPAFAMQEFDELKRTSLTSVESRRGDPAAIASTELSRHLHPYPKGHPRYTQTIDEQLETLHAVSLEDVRSCYRDLAGATGADFAAVGDFDAEEVMRLVEALFGDWRTPHAYTRIPGRHFARAAQLQEIRTPDKANAVLRGGLNVPMRDDHPDYPALVLANYLLGGSASARIAARIREKEGLSYSTYSWLDLSPFDPVGSFGISVIFAPQNRARVERALREEIDAVLREGFRAEEIESGKAGLLKARQLARSQDRALAARLGSYLHLRRTFAWDAAFERGIAALSNSDLRDALRRHLDPASLSVVVAGDLKE